MDDSRVLLARLFLSVLLASAALATPGLCGNAVTAVQPRQGGQRQSLDLTKTLAEYLKIQREHPKKIKEKLGLDCNTLETQNFIIHGSIDQQLMKETSVLCEGLHSEFKRIFKYKKKEKLYAGKLELFLWQDRGEFIKFAAGFDGYDATHAGGYFTSRGPLAHVNMYWDTRFTDKLAGKARFFEVTIHELTHAHLRFYRSHNRIRVWVHEGFANLMAWYVIRRYGDRKIRDRVKTKDYFANYLRRQAEQGKLRSMKDLMRQRTMPGNDIEGYALAWIVAANLVNMDNGMRFLKFVKAMKDEPAETARPTSQELLEKSFSYQDWKFKECFGVTPQQFERWLLNWIVKNKSTFHKAFPFQ